MFNRLMASAMAAYIGKHQRRKPGNMTGPGRKTLYTFHKPSGSWPVPGGGLRERTRRMERMIRAEARHAN